MIWNNPKNIWQWLMLASPGAASLAFTGFGKAADDEVGAALLGLPITYLLCIAIGYLPAREPRSAGKIFGMTLLFIFLLVIVNFPIALGGCAVMQPYFNI